MTRPARAPAGGEDAAGIVVPERYAEFAFEYKEGYRSAAIRWKWNPVRGRVAGGRARDAWRAGRERALKDAKRRAALAAAAGGP